MPCDYCFHCQQQAAALRDEFLVRWGKDVVALKQDEHLIKYHDEARQSTITAILRKDGSQSWLEEIPDALH